MPFAENHDQNHYHEGTLRLCSGQAKGRNHERGARGVLKSEGEFQGKADVAFFGGEDTKIYGIRQSLKKIILDFSVVLVG